MTSVLSVQSLAKQYGRVTAVKDVSFEVASGEIVGLLGPNGAGKTTTINMLLGILQPSAGSIYINGIDITKRRAQALERTNFAAVYAPLPGNLTVAENLRIFGLLYSVRNLRARMEEVMEIYHLMPFRNTKCGVLSSGEQTRVCLAKAMLNRPTLLLLDEPTASLDPSTAQDIRTGLRALVTKGDMGVLWTSHNMAEVEAVCDRVLFMAKGSVLLQGNPKTLPAEHGKKTLEELFITVAREPLSLGADYAA